MSSAKFEALPIEVKQLIKELDSKYCDGEVFAIEYDNCEAYSDHWSYILGSYFKSYRRAVEYILEIGGLQHKAEILHSYKTGEKIISFVASDGDYMECRHEVLVLNPA